MNDIRGILNILYGNKDSRNTLMVATLPLGDYIDIGGLVLSVSLTHYILRYLGSKLI